MENQRRQWGYYGIEIKWEYDNDPDLSHLMGGPASGNDGRYDEYIVDRPEGRLLGKWETHNWTLPFDSIPDATINEDGWPSEETWEKATAALKKAFDDARIVNDNDFDFDEEPEWDEEKREFYCEFTGRKILADGLWSSFERMGIRYYYIGSNHLPHNPESWSHVSPEGIADVVAQYGSIEQADIAYAVEDWQRWEKYGRSWWMMGCIVTLYKDGVEIASSSCWGIESDCGKEHEQEMIESILADVLHQANIGLSGKTVLAESIEWEEA